MDRQTDRQTNLFAAPSWQLVEDNVFIFNMFKARVPQIAHRPLHGKVSFCDQVKHVKWTVLHIPNLLVVDPLSCTPPILGDLHNILIAINNCLRLIPLNIILMLN